MSRKASPLACAIETERFMLRPLGRWEAFRLSYPWTKDAELMRSFSRSGRPRTRRQWYREMARPDNRKRFSFAIVPKGETACIGMHMIRLQGYRSAMLSVVIEDRAWWGRGVVREVRSRLIDHFMAVGAIERFWGQVTARNLPSIFNYQTLGFDHVGTLHRAAYDPETGEVYDLLIFELMSVNWKPAAAVADG
jgi:RimJ/RimL family protein N-acetyltransferase